MKGKEEKRREEKIGIRKRVRGQKVRKRKRKRKLDR